MLKLLLGLAAVSLLSASPDTAPSLSVRNDGRLEHVLLQAPPERGLTLTGWRLVSVVGDQKFQFPAVSLGAGATLRVISGATEKKSGDMIWTRQNMWNNDGDTALLFDAGGTLVAAESYGNAPRPSSVLKASSLKGSRTSR